MSKQLNETQRRIVDGAFIIGGITDEKKRAELVAMLEPVLVDMIAMAYEKGVEDAFQAAQKSGAVPEGLG